MDWAVLYVYGLETAIPGMSWVAIPIISDVDQEIIRLVVDALSKSEVMMAFFMNTVLRKATQSDEFVKAVELRNSLPEGVSDEEYKKAEAAQMDAFRNFVVLSN